MADIKELKTRIALKYDTYTNWTNDTEEGLGANLVLLKGEIGICEIPSGNNSATTAPTVLFKVGDGDTPFKLLKWASALAADVYAWAKASDVVVDGKTIKFVGGNVDAQGNKTDKVITLNFATPDEVAAAVKAVSDDLGKVAQRVTTLEGLFGDGENTIDSQLEALEGRMTTAEGDIDTLESTKLDASEFTAFNDGTFKKVSEIEADIAAKANAAKSGAEATAASALAGAVSTLEAADSALGGRIDGLVGDNGTIAAGDAATLASAKSYADTKKSEVIGDANSTKDSDTVKGAKLFATDAANTAKAGAEKTASDALATAVQTLNAKDAELVAEDSRLAGLIGDNATAIATEKSDRETAITNVTTAYTTAIGNAKTELEGKITAEETARTNAINTLTQTVNTNAGTVTSEIARVEGLIEDEAKARDDADKAFDARLDKVETFFEGAYTEDGQPVKEALDTLVEIQNYITGEGEAASALLDAIETNATAIGNLEDRVDTAEDDIDALEGRATALEGTVGDANNGLVKAVADLETKTAGFTGTISARVEEVSVRAEKGITDAAGALTAANAADSKAQTAQNEVDALEVVVAGVKSTAEDAQGRVAAVEGVLNGTNNDGLVKDVADLKTASATYAAKSYVDETFVDKTTYATDKAATEQALGNVYTKTDADDKFATITTVNDNTTEIGKNAAAIAKNAGDIATNTTAIGNEKTRAEGEEAAIRNEFAAADLEITNKIGDVGTGTVAAAISAAQTAAQGYADTQVNALKTGDVATNASEIAKVSGRVQTLEDRFGGWFVIDCGSSTTVIDETK